MVEHVRDVLEYYRLCWLYGQMIQELANMLTVEEEILKNVTFDSFSASDDEEE